MSRPSEAEYVNRIDKKTGTMFRMLSQLLQAKAESMIVTRSPEEDSKVDLDNLTLLFGRFFQIRDDFINLRSVTYSEQMGYCEDLDEEKYSFPIVILLSHKPAYRDYVKNLPSASRGYQSWAKVALGDQRVSARDLRGKWKSRSNFIIFGTTSEGYRGGNYQTGDRYWQEECNIAVGDGYSEHLTFLK